MNIICTCHPAAEGDAQAELRRSLPDAGRIQRLHPGILLVETPRDIAALSPIFWQAPILFTRHLFPAEYVWPAQIDPIAAADTLASRLDRQRSYSIQARSFDGDAPTRPLSEALQSMGFQLDIRNPAQVVSLYRTSEATYAGVSSPQDNLSSWNGGMMHFRAEGSISRAEFKLLEALRTFPIPMDGMRSALDLGAAPGGWSRVLADEYGLSVDAVDPAALDPRLSGYSRIQHHAMTAAAFQRAYPDRRFDLIVNDMKMDTRLSLDILLSLRPQLQPDGWMLATLKLPRVRPGDAAAHAIHRLRAQATNLYARQLFHNRSEITVAFQ